MNEPKSLSKFQGTVSLITGGASGLGKALAFKLAQTGSSVIICDVNDINGTKTCHELQNRFKTGAFYKVDVSDTDSVTQCINDIVARYGRIDFIINNAGVGMAGEVHEFTLEQWQKTMDINLMGVIYGSLAAYKIMLQQRSGHIINISSLAGIVPFPVHTPYTTSKYGVAGFTASLRSEARIHNIETTLVCPGIVETDFYHSIEVVNADKAAYTGRLPQKILSAEKAANIIITGIARRKKLIIFPFHAILLYYAYRFSPSLCELCLRYLLHEFRKLKTP